MITDSPKNRIIPVRMNNQEFEKIKNKAEKLGLDISSYLRFIGMRASITEIKVGVEELRVV